MKIFSSSLIPGLARFLFCFILLSGCSKRDFQAESDAKENFNVADAKEWWYGAFKKSSTFNSFNPNSNFLRMKEGQLLPVSQYLTPEKRYPSWKTGMVHQVGSTTFIQFALVQAYTSIPIPNKSGENELDRKRIANATIQKLLIVKLPDGRISVRVVTIIPALDYLRIHQYFNPVENVLDLPRDFSGIVHVRDWNEKNKGIWQYKDGKRRAMQLRLITDDDQNRIVRMSMPCEPYWGVLETERWCIDVHNGSADEPSGYCDDPNNWHERIVEGWIYPDGDCGEFEDPCTFLSYEECLCITYGLGCEGGGGDGDPPPPEPDPCEEAQPAAEAVGSLSQNGSFINGKSGIQGQNALFEHTVTFGRDANGNITASPVNIGTGEYNGDVDPNWPGAFADLHNHPNNLPPSAADMYNLIGLNNSHNGYNTRMVVTKDGTVYALVITDLAKANSFKSTHEPLILNNQPDFPTEVFDKFQDVRGQFIIEGLSSTVAEERALAYVLDFYNTGFLLLKQDSNGNLKRLVTNKNIVNSIEKYVANNCP